MFDVLFRERDSDSALPEGAPSVYQSQLRRKAICETRANRPNCHSSPTTTTTAATTTTATKYWSTTDHR